MNYLVIQTITFLGTSMMSALQKTILMIFAVVFSTSFSYATSFEVIDRDEDFDAVKRVRKLKDLTSNDSFEGKHFKIVLGKSSKAVSFDSDEDVLLKAATTYYHLTKAREYFVETLKSESVKARSQTTIRIDIKNEYSELGHFAHDNAEPLFNNALTIPAGSDFRDPTYTWGEEIWFRPSKVVGIDDVQQHSSSNEIAGLLSAYRSQVHMITLQRFLAQAMLGELVPNGSTPLETLIRLAGASIIIETAYLSGDYVTGVFSRKSFWLESALVPEIIYHEYAHLALSEDLELSHSSPVNEGMADFFAARIADHDELATDIDDYNTFSGKKAKNKDVYKIQFETTAFANTDFVFGLLWALENVFKGESHDKFVFSLRKSIDSNSNIRDQLLNSIIKQCRKQCDSPNADMLKIYKMLHSKGL